MGKGCLTCWFGHRAATACSVHLGNANEVAGVNAHAARPIVCRQCGEQLNDLSIDFKRDETVAVGVEAGDRARFVFNGALERGGCARFETEQEAPERSNQQHLERCRSGDGRAELERFAKRCCGDSARAEPDHEREQQSRREERRPAPSRGGSVFAVLCVRAVRSLPAMSGVRSGMDSRMGSRVTPMGAASVRVSGMPVPRMPAAPVAVAPV